MAKWEGKLFKEVVAENFPNGWKAPISVSRWKGWNPYGRSSKVNPWELSISTGHPLLIGHPWARGRVLGEAASRGQRQCHGEIRTTYSSTPSTTNTVGSGGNECFNSEGKTRHKLQHAPQLLTLLTEILTDFRWRPRCNCSTAGIPLLHINPGWVITLLPEVPTMF